MNADCRMRNEEEEDRNGNSRTGTDGTDGGEDDDKNDSLAPGLLQSSIGVNRRLR